MDAKSDQKTKKSTLLSWKCSDWIEIVESEEKRYYLRNKYTMLDVQETPEKANDTKKLQRSHTCAVILRCYF